MNKLRKGDDVIVIAGKDKGKRGIVMQRIDNQLVKIEGVNRVKKHTKPNPGKNEVGGILEREMPIQISNVALFNKQTQKADRVGFKFLEDGRKVRIFKSNGEMVDV